jgi:2,4-dienoyl-CoA reductase-like NADH-dependent reductase (Old Yellow Enzyme family)
MAIIRNNLITRGYSGKIGGIILRQRGNKTIMALAPKVKKKQKPTQAQQAARHRFATAIAMTRELMNDPEKVKYYSKKAKGTQTAWNVAMKDCMEKVKKA